jgi:hypothetical protein
VDMESLLVFGEIGVALAGFSGITVAIGRRAQGHWDEADRQRLQDLLIASLGAACFAILPIVLTKSGMVDVMALQLCSGVFALYLLVAAATILRGGRGKLGLTAWIFMIPMLLVIAMLGLAAAGLLSRVIEFPYYLALFWLLFLSATNFMALLLDEADKE